MRIVIIRANGIDPDVRVEKEANSLKCAGHDVKLIAWDRSCNHRKTTDLKELIDCQVERISYGSKAKFGAGLKSIIPYLKFQFFIFNWLIKNRNSYDIAHLCDFHTAFFGGFACKIAGKKYVFDVFDTVCAEPKSLLQRIVNYLEKVVINNSEALILCSEQRLEQIKGSNPKKISIIHNTPYDVYMKKKKNIIISQDDADRTKIAYIGTFQDKRCILELMDVVSQDSSLELHIGGFGELEEQVKLKSLKENNIFYYGKIDYEKTIDIEEECDILPALYDPVIYNHKYAAPNKFYEGLMLGKPLLMIKGSGMSNIVESEGIGVCTTPNYNGILNGINELKDKKTEWIKMGQRARMLYDEKYSWNVMEHRLCKLYEELSIESDKI